MTGDVKNIKILFFGDLVGRPGRFAVRDFLEKINRIMILSSLMSKMHHMVSV